MAVLINKAMIEIPPKFAGRPPVNPEARKDATLLAPSGRVRRVSPKTCVTTAVDARRGREAYWASLSEGVVTEEMVKERPDLKPYVGKELTVIAWLWARTVKSPNPAFANVEVPLASTFMLSTKPGNEAYVDPVVENGAYLFTVRHGSPNDQRVPITVPSPRGRTSGA